MSFSKAYRALDVKSSGSEFHSQRMVGVGFPVAAQGNVVVCPTSTTMVVGGGAILGKPGGTLSARIIEKRHIQFNLTN